jgi:Zn-dependent M28 family amino/carboxypeptidase
MKKSHMLLAALFCASTAQAQINEEAMLKYASTITADDLKAHLQIIASDAYEGRETGQKGQKMAAEYIKNHFQSVGLSGPVKANAANPYFQPFELTSSSLKSGQITAGKNTLNLYEQFFSYGIFSMNQSIEAVYVGHGLEEDYKALGDNAVQGKAVVVASGAPKGSASAGEGQRLTGKKLQLAKKMGATLIILVTEDEKMFEARNAMFKNYYQKPSLGFAKMAEEESKILFISPAQLPALLQIKEKSFAKAKAKAEKNNTSLAGKFTATLKVNMEVENKPVMTENVLGFIEGTDKKDEILVLTAHYDHVGIIDGNIHNGADDDGSGTVAVLEMAQAFAEAKKAGHGPRRSILFMTVTGEEKGLLGSEYYAENPIFPLENTVVNLNTDMIGRVDDKHKDNPNYVYIIGSDMLSSELHTLHEEVAKRHASDVELDYEYNNDTDPNRYYYRSDHYNFAKNNIPVIFYFNGTHPDYHKPGDDVEKINFDKMSRITRLTFNTAWVIANRDQRPAVDKATKKE